MAKGDLFNPCKCGCANIVLHWDKKYFWCECMECGCKTDKYVNYYQAINEWDNGKEKII